MRQEGRQVMGRGEYIIIPDRDNFVNSGVRDEIIHAEHWMILTVLQWEGALRNCRYIVSRMW